MPEYDVAIRYPGGIRRRQVQAANESEALKQAAGNGPWTQPAVIVLSVGEVSEKLLRDTLRGIVESEHLRRLHEPEVKS